MTITFSQLIRNNTVGSDIPVSANAEMLTQELSLPVRKNILELRNDRTLRFKFSYVSLDEFWFCIEEVAYMSEF